MQICIHVSVLDWHRLTRCIREAYLAQVDAGERFDQLRHLGHDGQHLARQLGSAHFTVSGRHHRHLLGLRQWRRYLGRHLKKKSHFSLLTRTSTKRFKRNTTKHGRHVCDEHSLTIERDFVIAMGTSSNKIPPAVFVAQSVKISIKFHSNSIRFEPMGVPAAMASAYLLIDD